MSVIALVIGLGVESRADTVNLQCPATLKVQQSANAVGAWQVYMSTSSHPFSRLRLYSGNPQAKLLLDPDNGDDDPSDYRWTLGEAGNNLWVECDYRGTSARLIQPLPKGLSSCQLIKSDHVLTLYCQPYVTPADQ